jgi:hypothetical protein
LVFEQGDQDGILKPTERGFMPMPWLEAPTALLPPSPSYALLRAAPTGCTRGPPGLPCSSSRSRRGRGG